MRAVTVEKSWEEEIYPRVPRPIAVDWIGPPNVCPLMEDTLRLSVERVERLLKLERYPSVPRPIAVDWIGCAIVCPLILEMMSCGVHTVPLAVKMPVLICRDEMDVVMISPMLIKPLLEPIARESTTREEI